MKNPLDIFTFLKGKKPDWYPAKVKMNKDGSISMMSFRDHTFEGYWEILLIGFNDVKNSVNGCTFTLSGLNTIIK